MLIHYCLWRPNKVCPCRGYRGFPPSISFRSSSKHFICRYEALSVLSPHHSLFVQAIVHEINLTAWNPPHTPPPPPPCRLASQHLDLQYFVQAEVVHTLSCGKKQGKYLPSPTQKIAQSAFIKAICNASTRLINYSTSFNLQPSLSFDKWINALQE